MEDKKIVDNDIEDIEFSREEARKLLGSSYKQISEKRWNRIRELIDFRDLVLDISGKRAKGDAISCPFHGRDSNPSFHLYTRSNDAYCFGCPPGDQYWDHTKFVSRILGMTRVGALKWIEDKYNLPKIEDDIEEVDEEHIILLTFDDVKETFIKKVRELINQEKDDKISLLRDLMKFYYLGEKTKDALPLAQVLGLSKVRSILKEKEKRLELGDF